MIFIKYLLTKIFVYICKEQGERYYLLLDILLYYILPNNILLNLYFYTK